MSKPSLERKGSHRTKLSFDEFKVKTLTYLQTQNVAPPQIRAKSNSRSRGYSKGKVARVIPGGTRPYLSEDSEEESVIRRIIEQRELSISRVDEVSISKEASRSLEEESKQDFEPTIEQLKQKEARADVQKTMQRRQVCMQVLAQLSGDKSCSFSMSQFEQSSGSETEKPSEAAEGKTAIIAVVNDLLKEPLQKTRFHESIAAVKGKKLSLLLKGREVEGVYYQGPSHLHLVYPLKPCPDLIPIKHIRKCYRLLPNELSPLPLSQLSSADAVNT